MIVRNFLGYGILITIVSIVLGLPLARLIERLKIGRWWSYLAFAAATGALLGAILSSQPSCAAPIPGSGEQESCVENPFAITFSPWTRSEPGFAGDNPPIQWSDYGGTIAYGAVIGSVLGISFWFFYSRRKRT
jgi:4-amino-4-deoxy-L-arabinose transferase-like glycosyltransferase